MNKYFILSILSANIIITQSSLSMDNEKQEAPSVQLKQAHGEIQKERALTEILEDVYKQEEQFTNSLNTIVEQKQQLLQLLKPKMKEKSTPALQKAREVGTITLCDIQRIENECRENLQSLDTEKRKLKDILALDEFMNSISSPQCSEKAITIASQNFLQQTHKD